MFRPSIVRRVPGPNRRGRGLRIVVASDKFKAALTAPQACASISEGVRRVAPEAEIDVCPMADGGEGTADALAGGGGRVIEREVTGPLPGTRVLGKITLLDDADTAVIDMASAAGFDLLDEAGRDPTRTTTYGVGELIRYAVEMECSKVVVGLGGSATCDAGLGAAQALGSHLFLENGLVATEPMTGGDLIRLTKIDLPVLLRRTRVTCLCDVNNPLFGDRGAARVFAPQKGATPAQVEQLEAGVRHAARVCGRPDIAAEPGMGAAGGLGFGLALAARAELRPGVDACCDACKLDDRLLGTQLCITGEGRFDAQSLDGKVVSGIARRCDDADVPCVVLAGSIDPALDHAHDAGVTAYFPLTPGPATLAELLPQTEDRLAATAEQVMRLVLAIEC